MKQRRREVDCALFIKGRVSAFVSEAETALDFRTSVESEATEIAKGAFGAPFLTAIGFALEVEAEEFLGFQQSFLGLDGHAARAKKRVNSISENVNIAGAGFKAFKAGRKAQKDMEGMSDIGSGNDNITDGNDNNGNDNNDKDNEENNNNNNKKQKQDKLGSSEVKEKDKKTGEDEMMNEKQQAYAAQKLEDSMPIILNLAWAINTRDITKTLKHVCNKLFTDAGVDLATRAKRAEGVRILGGAFHKCGKSNGGIKGGSEGKRVSEMKTRAEVAIATTMAKAQGQEMTASDAEEMIAASKKMAEERKEEEKKEKEKGTKN